MSMMNPNYTCQPAMHQRGFTLLEVLITVVIFSVGLLGIAGLQMTGMKHTHNSHLRSVATTQAIDMADRMRANMEGVQGGEYVKAFNCTTSSVDCASSPCTAAQLAEYDMCQWTSETTAALPGGALAGAAVCLDDSPAPTSATKNWVGSWECSDTGNIFAIKIQWAERALDEDDQDTAGITTNLRHFYMRVTP